MCDNGFYLFPFRGFLRLAPLSAHSRLQERGVRRKRARVGYDVTLDPVNRGMWCMGICGVCGVRVDEVYGGMWLCGV